MMDAVGMEGLSALVRESAASGVRRQVLLLKTDVLPPSLSRPQHLRRARQALDPLTLADRARYHELPSGRMLVSWRGEAPKLLNDTITALDSILKEDPFEAPGLNQLITTYDLPDDGARLLQEAALGVRVRVAAPPEPAPRPVFQRPAPLKPLDTAALERLEHSLATVDLTRFARRRPISHYTAGGLQLAWQERTLSLPELIDTAAPGHDVKADPWLFRRLTRVLDRRLLSILSDGRELREAGPFGLTLNVASVLSPEFLRFDSLLPASLRHRVVIGLLPADIASDAGAYAFARNFARSRSYRICLRAITPALLPALDLPALELDFVQIVWNTDILSMRALPEAGSARWIIGRPCTQAAIEWGIRAGVSLYAANPTV